MAYRYDAEGTLRSNIPIAVTEDTGAAAGLRYRGYLGELTSNAIKGNTSPTYSVWTGTGQTGIRLNVLLEGTPGVNEILIVPHTGEMRRDTSATVYVYYLGCGDQQIVLQELTVALPFVLVDALVKVWHSRRITKKIVIGGAEVTIDGNLYGGSMSLILRNATPTPDIDVALSFNASTQKAVVSALASNLTCEVGDELQIVSDATTYRGQNISNATIALREYDDKG